MPTEQPQPHRHVEPLDVDAVRTVQIGTALWTVALLVTLIMRDSLDEQGRTWWIWTCAAAVVLGLVGLLLTTRRRRRLSRARSAGQDS